MPSTSSPAARLRKVAAVVSSVVLVALFIAYRSGGQTTRALPGSKSALVVTPTTTASGAPQASTGPTTVPFEVFSTSKSGAIVRPEVFSGSKSAAVFTPSDTIPLTSASQPTTTRVTTAPAGKP